LKEENNYQNQEEMRILDEESTKRLEEEICKKVEESLNIDDVKLKMQSRIEKGRPNLINGVTLQFQKEKEDKIQGHQKIHEEFELYLEDVHAKYDGIISMARVIKDQRKRIEDAIVSELKIRNEMHVQSEDKPSNLKLY
jgi:arginine/glutamate-rich protein 1